MTSATLPLARRLWPGLACSGSRSLVEPGWRPRRQCESRSGSEPAPLVASGSESQRPTTGRTAQLPSPAFNSFPLARRAGPPDEPVLLVVRTAGPRQRSAFERLGPCRIRLHDKDRHAPAGRTGCRDPHALRGSSETRHPVGGARVRDRPRVVPSKPPRRITATVAREGGCLRLASELGREASPGHMKRTDIRRRENSMLPVVTGTDVVVGGTPPSTPNVCFRSQLVRSMPRQDGSSDTVVGAARPPSSRHIGGPSSRPFQPLT